MSTAVQGTRTPEEIAASVAMEQEKQKHPISEAAVSTLKKAGEGLDQEAKISMLNKVGNFSILKEERPVQEFVKSVLPIPIDKSNLPARPEIKDLMEFLKASPTSFHAGSTARRLCVEQNGYIELKENQPWNWKITLGGKYFVARDASSFAAFVVPLNHPKSACILGAHTDSPGLKLKPNSEKIVDNAVLLCPEPYGGLMATTWMGQSLGLAGRIQYLDESGHEKSALIDFGKTIGTIPQLAIHLDRTQKEKVEINLQEHLPVVCWLHTSEGSPKPRFEEELRKIVPFNKLFSHELFFVPREAPEIVNDEFIHSFRLDNLLGTHAALTALTQSQPLPDVLQMAICWDHEEIGSNTQKGAASNFLESILQRVSDQLAMYAEDVAIMKANSGLISIDVTHGRHPNYYGKHEPNHAPLLGKGPVVKYHANQSYATKDNTASWILRAGDLLGIPVQKFVIRSDSVCGSTIGNIVAPKLGIPTVDIGAPIWSMHAIREKGSLLDHMYMIQLLKTLLSMDLSLKD